MSSSPRQFYDTHAPECQECTVYAKQLMQAEADARECRRQFFVVADAIAKSSSGPEELAGIARDTRHEVAALRVEAKRYRDLIVELLDDGAYGTSLGLVERMERAVERVAKALP